ncbi:MAG: hypothetical protein ABR548_08020 [Actinomycetota bacterium]
MDAQTSLEITDPAMFHQEVRTFVRILKAWGCIDKAQPGAGTAA